MLLAFFLRLVKGGVHSRTLRAVMLFLISGAVVALTDAQTKPVRRVVIFYEIGLSSPSVSVLDEEIRSALEDSSFQIDLYREYLETTLFPDPGAQKEIRDWYIHKYRNLKPDVVVAIGASPLRFLADSRQRFFRDVPVVFGGISGMKPEIPGMDSGFTGVWDITEPAKTLETALRLRPGTRHVVVVGGQDAFDLELEAWYHEHLRSYESKLDFIYLTDLPMPRLEERLRTLPANSIVLLTHIGLDGAGTHFVGASQADPLVVAAANAPVFGPSDVDLGHGEVGGYLDSFAVQGKMMSNMVIRILSGEKPQSIPALRGADVYMFDWNALVRWQMNEKNLPPGSIVLNRQPTPWELYKWYIIGGISLILLEALLISALLWQHARRAKAEEKLREYEKAVEGAEDMIGVIDREYRFLLANRQYLKMRNLTRQQVVGQFIPEVLGREVFETAVKPKLDECFAGKVVRYEGKFSYPGVGERDLWLSYYPIEGANGTIDRAACILRDITDRKRAEEALSSMNRKLIESQEQERTRIGRELHDDINQRLALLAVELDRWDQSGSTNNFHQILQESKERVMEIATDVQAISHQLHSSKLEYLGLAAAAKSFCREISELHNVRIDFTQDVPRNLPEEVALCLFRVLQEALQNAVKYSGSDHFEVDLCGTSADVWLKVHDFGRGFSVEDVIKGKGLGLVSMRQRVNLVNGEIAIKSRPKAGTEITVRVPLRIADRTSEVASGAA